MKRSIVLLFLLAALLWPRLALAQTCTATATATINFGTVDVLLNAPVDITGTVTVSCTGLANRTVRACLNIGEPNGGTVGGVRIAQSGVNTLNYELYSDAARTVKWSSSKTGGVGVEVLVPINAAGTSTPVVRTIFGRVFAGQQTVPPGTYTAVFSGSFTQIQSRYSTVAQTCSTMTAIINRFPFTVSATVPAKCTVANASLDFGAAMGLMSAVNSSTNLSVACSRLLPFRIQLSTGGHASATPTTRRMSRAANFVTYALYRDAARTQPFGWTLGTDTVSGTGTGLAVSIPVFGQVPAQTTPPPGIYTDRVVITVNY